MIACDLAALLLFLSVPVAAWLDRLTIGHLLAVALGAGTASVFFQTAHQVYLPSLLDRDEVAEGNARLQATEAAARVGGPGVAGLITQVAGAVNALLVDAASFLISALCLLAIRAREPRLRRTRLGQHTASRDRRWPPVCGSGPLSEGADRVQCGKQHRAGRLPVDPRRLPGPRGRGEPGASWAASPPRRASAG